MDNNIPDKWDKQYHEFFSKGTIVKTETEVKLCPRCDGFGIDGHEQISIDGVSQPNLKRALTCKVCGGFGYVKYIVYTRDDGGVHSRLLDRE